MKRLIALATAAFVVGVLALPAQAVKPTVTPSIVLATADPHLGGIIDFATVAPKVPGNTVVRIQVICYQDGALVYGEAYNVGTPFLLGGGWSRWLENGGPASCTADLYYWSYSGSQVFNLLASTSFAAAG